MPGDSLGPEDLDPAGDPRIAEAIRAALRAHELRQAVSSAFNAREDALHAVAMAQQRAHDAALCGPPLPPGFHARQRRERQRRADMRALLQRLRDQ